MKAMMSALGRAISPAAALQPISSRPSICVPWQFLLLRVTSAKSQMLDDVGAISSGNTRVRSGTQNEITLPIELTKIQLRDYPLV
jgi:hypothetical protein